MTGFEAFVAEKLRSRGTQRISGLIKPWLIGLLTYWKDIPYCETVSNPDFHTRVTSQALVAWSLQERKAETALPPTIQSPVRSESAVFGKLEQLGQLLIYQSALCKGSAGKA